MTQKRTFVLVLTAVIALAIGAATAWSILDPGFRMARGMMGIAPDVPKDEFERRVRAYLLDNPEVIIEAMQVLEARQRTAAQTEVQAVLTARADEVFRDPESPVGGNPEGDVTLVEFFDYNCPYCRQVAPVMAKAEAADQKLRVVYKEFPILGPNSIFAAKAALAAHRQERYVPFHQALMQSKSAVNEETVLATAAKIGLDVDRLKADMNDSAIQTAIDRNLALAGVLRINGTPSFVVGEEIVRGATDLNTLQGLIQKARATPRSDGKP